jgi:signal transduction histidine kinase
MPGSTPEISQTLPNIPDTSKLTVNDSGIFQSEQKEPITEAIHDEFEPIEAMPDFAEALINISKGYESIFSKISDEGTFNNEADEQETQDKFNTWQDKKTLPVFDIKNPQESVIAIQSILDKMQTGEVTLNYADSGSLISYFRYKYPNDAQFIDKIFADFSHDVTFVSNGVLQAINQNEGSRKEFLKKILREWPVTIFESTAQLLKKDIVMEEFNPLQSFKEIKDLFTEIAATQEVHFNMGLEIDPRAEHINIRGNKLWLKRAIYNHARNVEKYAELTANRDRNFYDNFLIQVLNDQLFIFTSDNRDGFRDNNFQLIDPKNSERVHTKSGKTVTRKRVFSHGAKGSDSMGSGFGTNIFWQVFVNMMDGTVNVENSPRENQENPTGSKYTIVLPISSKESIF